LTILPADLRLIPLKYGGRCRSCAVRLEAGERAHWSPSTKKIWCAACAGAKRSLDQSTPDSLAGALRNAANDAGAPAAEAKEPEPDGSQSPWQQLCRYAQRCIEAEAAKSLAPYARKDALWFSHHGEEKLVVGQSDSISAPEKLSEQLALRSGSQDRRMIIYGWPTVVMVDRDHRPMVAPLFSIRIEPQCESDGKWRLHATSEPEFNLAITASGMFDPSVTEEIDELLGNGLPFGDADAFADLAGRTAGLLALDIRSPLTPVMLDSHAGRGRGVYNAAVSVVTEASGFNVALVEELRELRKCEDWTTTAAALLLPRDSGPEKDDRSSSGPLAAPLACNQSQEETLERLRRERLVVVTGPPGTGKTQLVVNAVTNAWLDGDKVLVTSTNNAAVDVAVARAESDVGSGLLMRTGNRAERDQVPNRITVASGRAAEHTGDPAEVRARLKRVSTERARLMEKLVRLDKLDGELLQIADKLEKARRNLREATQALWAVASPPDLSIDSRTMERQADRLSRAWLFRRFRVRRLRRRIGCVETASLQQIVAWARCDQQRSNLTRELERGQADCERLKSTVGDPAVSVRDADRDWIEASLCAIRADTATRIRSGVDRLAAFGRASTGGAPFKRVVANSLHSLRGWACTTLSTSQNFPLESGLFDLVIVDEASQCSLAAVLPLAYRAKRLAVVGDPSQLQPIVPVGDRLLQEIAVQTGFESDDLRRRGIHHKYGSAYLAFESAAQPHSPVLLSEHYRCHPHIARWFNRTFYGDRLIVLTDVADTNRRDRTILWQDVTGVAERPPSGSSWLNRVEAAQVIEWLGKVLESESTVGVITPFAAQAQLVRTLAEDRFGRSALDDAGFMCGTAHRLQGDERDAILVSPVLSPGMSGSGARWIEKERNLLNVAVSRARRALLVLGHPSVGELGSPTLASLRTYLRDEVARNEGIGEIVADFRTDSRAEELLLDAMQLGDLRPYAKLNVEGYELDFALMEQGVKLDIEVDGDQHYDARGQRRRQDITRDRVLSNLGWTTLRIPAWRCYEELGAVIDEIRKVRDRALDEALGLGTPVSRC